MGPETFAILQDLFQMLCQILKQVALAGTQWHRRCKPDFALKIAPYVGRTRVSVWRCTSRIAGDNVSYASLRIAQMSPKKSMLLHLSLTADRARN